MFSQKILLRISEDLQTDRIYIDESSRAVRSINDIGGVFDKPAVSFLAFAQFVIERLQVRRLLLHGRRDSGTQQTLFCLNVYKLTDFINLAETNERLPLISISHQFQ